MSHSSRSPLLRRKRARPMLGTFVEIELASDAEEVIVNSWIETGFAAVAEVERLMSFHREDSDLSRLNRAEPGRWVDIDPLTAVVLRASDALRAASRGVFDPRCGAVLVRRGTLPAPLGVSRRAAWRGRGPAVELAGTRARKTGRWVLDLGGVAKGFAVDQSVEAIRKAAGERKHSGLVNAGGDLRVWGAAAPAMIRCRSGLTPPLALLCAAATSASRSDAGEGARLTRTDHVSMPGGRSRRRPETATVFADRCMIADALTKVVLLGSEEVAAACLAAHRAKAALFSADGRLTEALG